MLWIFLTIFGALMNNLRLALQKNLNNKLSTEIVTWARYSFGLPLALLYFFLAQNSAPHLPQINSNFFFFAILASLFQILGTIALVNLFQRRNFAVGFSYSKTEAIQTVLIGAIFFGELISIKATFAILLGIIGIVIIAAEEKEESSFSFLKRITSNSALLGIFAGLCFAISGLSIRNTSLSLGESGLLIKNALVLLVIIFLQFLILGAWILLKNSGQFALLIKNWRGASLIGITSFFGSMGLFAALSLKEAAYVKGVTQIGIIFSMLISYFFFKEKIKRQEILGIAILMVSIILLIFFN